MMENIKERILSDAFEEMLNGYGEYVKEEVDREKGRIYADGYFEAIGDVLEIIDKKHNDIYNHDFMTDSRTAGSRLKLLEQLRKEVDGLKGEGE